MKKYKSKVSLVDAEQWFEVSYDREFGIYYLDVGYYRNPDMCGRYRCKHCQYIMHDHGWIDSHDGGQTVCPGDWIVSTEAGKYPLKDECFRAIFESVEGG